MNVLKRISVSAIALLASLVMLTGCSGNSGKNASETNGASASAGEESQSPVKKDAKVLRLNSFLPVDHPFTKDIVPMWIKKVEEATNGEVKVEWVGGPESLPPKDQFEAVRNGLIDVAFSTNAYYGNIMPVSNSLGLSAFTPAEERENGYFDYMVKQFEAQKVVYLGRMLSEQPFYLWSNKEVKTLEDLKGQRFRASPTFYTTMKALEIAPVEIVASDVYTALERKMVDGFGFPLLGPRDSAWTEVTKFIIKEPFLNQNTTILMYPAAFKELSEENQQNIKQATAEFENEMVNYFKEQNEKEWKNLQDSGLKVISFSPEESGKFKKIWTDAAWADMAAVAPEYVEDLKKMLLK